MRKLGIRMGKEGEEDDKVRQRPGKAAHTTLTTNVLLDYMRGQRRFEPLSVRAQYQKPAIAGTMDLLFQTDRPQGNARGMRTGPDPALFAAVLAEFYVDNKKRNSAEIIKGLAGRCWEIKERIERDTGKGIYTLSDRELYIWSVRDSLRITASVDDADRARIATIKKALEEKAGKGIEQLTNQELEKVLDSLGKGIIEKSLKCPQ